MPAGPGKGEGDGLLGRVRPLSEGPRDLRGSVAGDYAWRSHADREFAPRRQWALLGDLLGEDAPLSGLSSAFDPLVGGGRPVQGRPSGSSKGAEDADRRARALVRNGAAGDHLREHADGRLWPGIRAGRSG